VEPSARIQGLDDGKGLVRLEEEEICLDESGGCVGGWVTG
jgi:hypothetical protein